MAGTPPRTLVTVALFAVLAAALLIAISCLRSSPAAFLKEEACPDSRFSCITLRTLPQ